MLSNVSRNHNQTEAESMDKIFRDFEKRQNFLNARKVVQFVLANRSKITLNESDKETYLLASEIVRNKVYTQQETNFALLASTR